MKNKAVINYPLITNDSKGNRTHVKYSDKDEYWIEYDENNNLIHYNYSDKFKIWREYDENNTLRHIKENSDGYECWYDSDGNEIPDPNLVTEVTLDDIAKKFGVDVKSLKIKK